MARLYYSFTKTQLGFIGALYSMYGLRKLTFPKPTLSETKHKLLLGIENVQYSDQQSNSLFRDLEFYLKGNRVNFSEQLDFEHVSRINLDVWRACLGINFGYTRSYKWVAEKAGRPTAYRVVAHALSTNPIPILVPCHRVIGVDGKLHGYAGGLELKSALLKMEQHAFNS